MLFRYVGNVCERDLIGRVNFGVAYGQLTRLCSDNCDHPSVRR